mmetsp:Transcript_42878/g.110596  ORF Transcript_42878/g.110596 Transcript_42878/m.110596 type:complete len:1071 (-) Transcript_42878:315-3527(-)
MTPSPTGVSPSLPQESVDHLKTLDAPPEIHLILSLLEKGDRKLRDINFEKKMGTCLRKDKREVLRYLQGQLQGYCQAIPEDRPQAFPHVHTILEDLNLQARLRSSSACRALDIFDSFGECFGWEDDADEMDTIQSIINEVTTPLETTESLQLQLGVSRTTFQYFATLKLVMEQMFERVKRNVALFRPWKEWLLCAIEEFERMVTSVQRTSEEWEKQWERLGKEEQFSFLFQYIEDMVTVSIKRRYQRKWALLRKKREQQMAQDGATDEEEEDPRHVSEQQRRAPFLGLTGQEGEEDGGAFPTVISHAYDGVTTGEDQEGGSGAGAGARGISPQRLQETVLVRFMDEESLSAFVQEQQERGNLSEAALREIEQNACEVLTLQTLEEQEVGDLQGFRYYLPEAKKAFLHEHFSLQDLQDMGIRISLLGEDTAHAAAHAPPPTSLSHDVPVPQPHVPYRYQVFLSHRMFRWDNVSFLRTLGDYVRKHWSGTNLEAEHRVLGFCAQENEKEDLASQLEEEGEGAQITEIASHTASALTASRDPSQMSRETTQPRSHRRFHLAEEDEEGGFEATETDAEGGTATETASEAPTGRSDRQNGEEEGVISEAELLQLDSTAPRKRTKVSKDLVPRIPVAREEEEALLSGEREEGIFSGHASLNDCLEVFRSLQESISAISHSGSTALKSLKQLKPFRSSGSSSMEDPNEEPEGEPPRAQTPGDTAQPVSHSIKEILSGTVSKSQLERLEEDGGGEDREREEGGDGAERPEDQPDQPGNESRLSQMQDALSLRRWANTLRDEMPSPPSSDLPSAAPGSKAKKRKTGGKGNQPKGKGRTSQKSRVARDATGTLPEEPREAESSGKGKRPSEDVVLSSQPLDLTNEPEEGEATSLETLDRPSAAQVTPPFHTGPSPPGEQMGRESSEARDVSTVRLFFLLLFLFLSLFFHFVLFLFFSFLFFSFHFVSHSSILNLSVFPTPCPGAHSGIQRTTLQLEVGAHRESKEKEAHHKSSPRYHLRPYFECLFQIQSSVHRWWEERGAGKCLGEQSTRTSGRYHLEEYGEIRYDSQRASFANETGNV